MTDRRDQIRDQIRVNRSLGLRGDNWDNYAVALIGTEHEASGAEDGMGFVLPDVTRDTLIRHGRQDAAHALANTISILDRVKTLTRLIYVLTLFNTVLALAVMYFLLTKT